MNNEQLFINHINANPGALNPEWVIWMLEQLMDAGDLMINSAWVNAEGRSDGDDEPPMLASNMQPP